MSFRINDRTLFKIFCKILVTTPMCVIRCIVFCQFELKTIQIVENENNQQIQQYFFFTFFRTVKRTKPIRTMLTRLLTLIIYTNKSYRCRWIVIKTQMHSSEAIQLHMSSQIRLIFTQNFNQNENETNL